MTEKYERLIKLLKGLFQIDRPDFNFGIYRIMNQKREFNPRDTEFDLIYVNGDNNLENLKRTDETWKVRLIEENFKRLMFDVEDV